MNNDYIPKRNIPLPVQREVRKRCGFGCVICGNPIYDYDHMKEWANVKEHVAEDITLLCADHHREVTGKRLPRELVWQSNKNPFNLQQGHSSPKELFFFGNQCEVILGSDVFKQTFTQEIEQMIALMIDGIPIISFIYENEHLLLNLILFDQFNEVILLIEYNQLVYSTKSWDITFKGNKLVFREEHKKVFLEIIFETPNRVRIEKGRILCNGVQIQIESGVVITGTVHISIGGRFENNRVGFAIGKDPYGFGAGRRVVNVNRYTT